MSDECRLQWVQDFVRQALQSLDAPAVLRQCQGEAGVNSPAVDEDRTGATGALVAATFCSGQPEFLAQHLQEACTWPDQAAERPAVHGQCQRAPNHRASQNQGPPERLGPAPETSSEPKRKMATADLVADFTAFRTDFLIKLKMRGPV